ncbi:MAG: hypothetical protein H0X42_01455, partial [Solirubrobacterales bacterium]|nr:hypothetical protein [Solirubrobacterales bacterium]
MPPRSRTPGDGATRRCSSALSSAGRSPGCRSTTRRCCSAATGWPTPRRRAGCGRRSPSTSSATSPGSPTEVESPRAVPDELRIDAHLAIPLAEIELRASRSSGPGGQHANVTASRVEAVFDVTASRALDEAQRARLLERVGPTVTAVAQDARGQSRNRELALARLAGKIATGLR